MCGIAGYVGPQVPGRLQRMADALRHRGPDGAGYHEEGRWHLSMRRLAIVDLRTGDQPKRNADGTVVVFLNGEIYNHVEIRRDLERRGVRFESDHSDTEVLAHLYDEHGPGFAERLVGMFAIALLDRRTGVLHLVRDRFGKKPVYWFHDPATGEFQYASEFNALEVPAKGAEVDPASVRWYLSQKTMPGDRSIDPRIRRLPAGSRLEFDGAGPPRVVPWYRLEPSRLPRAAADEERALADVEALLDESVRLRMRADVEVGAFLSGGVDSSLVVTLAQKLSPRPLRTYCLVYDREILRKSADREFARRVASGLGTRHREVLLTPQGLREELPAIVAHYGEPNGAVLSNWFISREMGRELKVALSGDGADELFGSYFLPRAMAAVGALRAGADRALLDRLPPHEAAFVREAEHGAFVDAVDRFAVFPAAEQAALLRRADLRARSILDDLRDRERELVFEAPLDRALEWDVRELLCNQVLNYSDVLSMAHSLEVRTPYLDHRLAEYVFALPPDLKIRGTTTKHLLKRLARRHLPEELVDRPKEGFVEPAVWWLRDELADLVDAYLLSPRFDRRGLFDPDYVRRLVAAHRESGDFTLGKRVWNLLLFAVWEDVRGA